ncbi:hypothetical protein [Desulfoluna spongiiphila]|uniref:hypothetical protein n=1 Tax=Desulfoluna spongiiphila TaxID=419481 RepID=UPI000B86E934|nr:hypothetical protein [Desulfoluna spongiiphila]
MKLTGSKMEEDFREELIKSHQHHFASKPCSKIKEVLEQNGHPTSRAYILHWTPDQDGDFITVLINGEYVVTTEIDHNDFSVTSSVDRYELKDYLKGLSRMNQVRLLVAKDLSNNSNEKEKGPRLDT